MLGCVVHTLVPLHKDMVHGNSMGSQKNQKLNLSPKSSKTLIFLDSITNLPNDKGRDITLFVVNHLTKMSHFLPYNKIMIGSYITTLVLNSLIMQLSTTFQPSTNDETKHANKTLQYYL